jgi:hypothetical protein
VSMTVGLDALGQAGQIRVREQLAPALEIERCLPLGRMELDRQRHFKEQFYSIETSAASLWLPRCHAFV